MPFRTGIVIFERVEELDFVGPWEVMNVARRAGADHEVLLISEHGGAVHCNYGLTVETGESFQSCPQLDLIIVPGGQGTRTEVDNPAMIEFIARQAKSAAWTTSVCTGSFLLEKAGSACRQAGDDSLGVH